MTHEGFEDEDKIVDAYVEVKEAGGDGNKYIEELITKHFQLVQGDSFTSTGGYKTTFGYGWWIN